MSDDVNMKIQDVKSKTSNAMRLIPLLSWLHRFLFIYCFHKSEIPQALEIINMLKLQLGKL